MVSSFYIYKHRTYSTHDPKTNIYNNKITKDKALKGKESNKHAWFACQLCDKLSVCYFIFDCLFACILLPMFGELKILIKTLNMKFV